LTDLYEKERTLYREVSSRVERSLPGVEVLALELTGPERASTTSSVSASPRPSAAI